LAGIHSPTQVLPAVLPRPDTGPTVGFTRPALVHPGLIQVVAGHPGRTRATLSCAPRRARRNDNDQTRADVGARRARARGARRAGGRGAESGYVKSTFTGARTSGSSVSKYSAFSKWNADATIEDGKASTRVLSARTLPL
jgi:hypothetical protein